MQRWLWRTELLKVYWKSFRAVTLSVRLAVPDCKAVSPGLVQTGPGGSAGESGCAGNRCVECDHCGTGSLGIQEMFLSSDSSLGSFGTINVFGESIRRCAGIRSGGQRNGYRFGYRPPECASVGKPLWVIEFYD